MNIDFIKPFEPVQANIVPQGNEWIYEMKWDGVRIINYYNGDNVRLFNRKQNERTQQFPELLDIHSYCKASSVILDGEVIALGENGKPSFHQVMRRDALRNMDKVKQLIPILSVFYCIFDIVYYNDEWVNDWHLSDRKDLLSEIITPNEFIQLTPSYDDGETLFDVTKQQGMEGIVAKKLSSTYAFGGKDNRWLKIKNFQDIIAVVGGVTYRNGIVNAILLGLYDNDMNLHYIGHAGTGKLTQNDWRILTNFVDQLKIAQKPFVNEPERAKDAQWIKPSLTVKIKYIEWPKGRSIRQPSIQSFVDIPPTECLLPK
ncbi:ATP dependent DNA ligase [Evansella cellulosilytica DSM 2522]|uniref:DNA ligase (ATP) n=1 Tax=Evansella cellulosilytica (strain ATCC 21833 / DSM 2522 / FERM P-1141 / JCM 9156 / N-4) TaxID=649639 RepID=E6U0J0_EVAC2|nr:ATP dependent DNA ligase [Evansella cellulosilytica DSM 2522]